MHFKPDENIANSKLIIIHKIKIIVIVIKIIKHNNNNNNAVTKHNINYNNI